MSASLRIALYVGLALAAVAFVARIWRYKGLSFPTAAFLELVTLVVAPFPIPVLFEIIEKSTQSASLPVFNAAEQRVALFLGAVVLIGALVTTTIAVMIRAFRAPVAAAPK